MIAKSDLFILVVSSSLLAAGIYRWQVNLPTVDNSASVAVGNQAIRNSQSSLQQPTGTSVISAMQPVQTTATVNRAPASAGSTRQPQTNPISSTTQATLSATGNAQPLAKPAEQSTSEAGADIEPLYGVYIVKSGDYLSKIAQTYGTTVQALQEINGIDGTLINIGQELRYPFPAN